MELEPKKSNHSHWFMGGENRDGSIKFLVSNNAFTIKNANMQYVKDENSEYYWLSFRHITIGGLALKYTITIS